LFDVLPNDILLCVLKCLNAKEITVLLYNCAQWVTGVQNTRLLTDAATYHMQLIQTIRTTQKPIRGKWFRKGFRNMSVQTYLLAVLKKLVDEQRYVMAHAIKLQHRPRGLGAGDIGEFGAHTSTPGLELLQDDKSTLRTHGEVCSLVREVQRHQLLACPDKFRGDVLDGSFTCRAAGE
jgi:hypothetical protein